jgi:hypothetical protein
MRSAQVREKLLCAMTGLGEWFLAESNPPQEASPQVSMMLLAGAENVSMYLRGLQNCPSSASGMEQSADRFGLRQLVVKRYSVLGR